MLAVVLVRYFKNWLTTGAENSTVKVATALNHVTRSIFREARLQPPFVSSNSFIPRRATKPTHYANPSAHPTRTQQTSHSFFRRQDEARQVSYHPPHITPPVCTVCAEPAVSLKARGCRRRTSRLIMGNLTPDF